MHPFCRAEQNAHLHGPARLACRASHLQVLEEAHPDSPAPYLHVNCWHAYCRFICMQACCWTARLESTQANLINYATLPCRKPQANCVPQCTRRTPSPIHWRGACVCCLTTTTLAASSLLSCAKSRRSPMWQPLLQQPSAPCCNCNF